MGPDDGEETIIDSFCDKALKPMLEIAEGKRNIEEWNDYASVAVKEIGIIANKWKAQTLQEIRKEIEGMKMHNLITEKRRLTYSDIDEAHNQVIDQALQVIDKHLNEGDVASQANR